jgi:hypothetical protein
MSIQDLARKRSVQVLVGFGVVTIAGYYFWLKKQKDAVQWVKASGSNKLLTTASLTSKKKKKHPKGNTGGSHPHRGGVYSGGGGSYGGGYSDGGGTYGGGYNK